MACAARWGMVRCVLILSVFVTVLFVVMVGVGSASATEVLVPWWGVSSGSRPSTLSVGGRGLIVVTAQNRGDAEVEGKASTVVLEDGLPGGVVATGIEGIAGRPPGNSGNRGPVNCELASLTCRFEGVLLPYEELEVRIAVEVLPEAGLVEQVNSVRVSGGGAVRGVDASRRINIGSEPEFGVEEYTLVPENQGGSVDTQAGSHPFQLTSVLTLNQDFDAKGNPRPVALPKDLAGELPRGLFGNPTPFPQCTETEFSAQVEVQGNIFNGCPPQTAVGVATATIREPNAGFETIPVPIFNMKPLEGEPARFGFRPLGVVPVFLDTSVATGKGYAITVGSHGIIQIASLLSFKLTFWGVPGDARHNGQRGWECLTKVGTCSTVNEVSPPPFLVMPTSCEAPFESKLTGDSWAAGGVPSVQAEPVTYKLPVSLDGCNHLPFAPSITVEPDVPDASTSTGLTVGVHVSQNAALNPEALAESTLRSTTVVLPKGVALNPSSSNGLEACSETQVGFEGIEPGTGLELFTAGLPQPFCPNASKVGTVKIKTPLLPNPLEGSVYLAAQDENPFGSLIALYIVARDPVSGVLLKLPGEVVPDSVTGQIVSTFKNTPELPFEELELHFFGGERAPLGTPSHCGTYATSAVFVPWSGNEPVGASFPFGITAGPGGGPCPGAVLPFDPSLTAGSTNNQAGAYSPFTMTMSRDDGDQGLGSVSLRMPPGLSGTLSGVALCKEPFADEGECGPESLIGETTVSVGLGGEPYTVTGGRVYITGPYDGAPFGLSIVNPAKAGPFDLEKNKPCDCLVVRAKIEVDPRTAVLTITSDKTGEFKIPSIIDGIPLDTKHINVTVNRAAFTFNPTNCSALSITGSLTSVEEAVSGLSVPFHTTNCATLAFKPSVAASTSGKTSRKDGASLKFKLTYPKAPWGSQANVAKAKVDLPKQLPSRLTTLQKACVDKVFEANPANCPVASRIGSAKAITPIIPVPLEGPVYFVSHGGAKFPELVIELSGYGVKVDLYGETFISKAGITSSTLRTIPDVPVGTFELTLPQGPYSALAANGNLCTSKLGMPTAFTAQNGLTTHQTTKITVTGCTKPKKTKKTTTKNKKKK